MPTPSPGTLSRGSPHLIVDSGQRYTLGWQDSRKDGPCFVVARLGFMGDKVLDRFPLTADGWAQAWAALVGLDAGAAQAVAERAQKLLDADAAQTAEMERQAQVYEAFENAGGVTVFRQLGVQVLVGDGKVFTIGSHSATTKTDNSRLLGPLAGAEAWVDADNGEGFDGYDLTASLAKTMRFGGSPLPGTQAQATSTVLCANGEKHQTKVYGFTSALRRVQREVAAFNAMVAAPKRRSGA